MTELVTVESMVELRKKLGVLPTLIDALTLLKDEIMEGLLPIE